MRYYRDYILTRRGLRSWSAAFVVAFLALTLVSEELVAQQGYQIVVNSGNAVSSMTADEVSRIFLKHTTMWPDGSTVIPVDLPQRSPVRVAFSRGVHGRSAAAIKAHWQRQIFSGRAVPPLEQASIAEVLAFIRANPTAVGYVAAGTTIGAGVKALRVN